MNIVKILGIGGLLAAIVALNACKPAPLSSEEAFEQIKKTGVFPKLIPKFFQTVEPASPLGRELLRLIKEGYMTAPPSVLSDSVIADKGKNIVEQCRASSTEFYNVILYTHVVDVDPKADKRISVHGDSAEIQFTLKGGLSEYGQHLRQIDPSCVDPKTVGTPDKQPIGGEGVAYFERWESGWRLVRMETPYGNFENR